MTGSKSLGDTGFLQFLGLFQVIMANPGGGLDSDTTSQFHVGHRHHLSSFSTGSGGESGT